MLEFIGIIYGYIFGGEIDLVKEPIPSQVIERKHKPVNIKEKSKVVKNAGTFFGHKDELFNYQGKILEAKYDNDYLVIDYNERRDIEDRDEIDVKKVYDKYVEKLPDGSRREKSFIYEGKQISYWEVRNRKTKVKDIKYITMYFHGMGGTRHQGIQDYSFGGNFNRIQNLMYKNNGVYVSSDIASFYEQGVKENIEIIKRLKKDFPNAKIILSGASSGGTLLWNIIETVYGTENIDGIILMGSVTAPYRQYKNILHKNIPIYISHGTRDKQIPYKAKEIFYNDIKSKNSSYPIKIEIFKDGVHGTPIRMTDWKKVLEFIFNRE